MIWIYSIIILVVLSVALCFGLVGAIFIFPQGATDASFYTCIGKITTTVIIAIILIFCVLKKTGHIRLDENLIKNY